MADIPEVLLTVAVLLLLAYLTWPKKPRSPALSRARVEKR
jgi:hypothetical protein